jgi:hypothetical protein
MHSYSWTCKMYICHAHYYNLTRTVSAPIIDLAKVQMKPNAQVAQDINKLVPFNITKQELSWNNINSFTRFIRKWNIAHHLAVVK